MQPAREQRRLMTTLHPPAARAALATRGPQIPLESASAGRTEARIATARGRSVTASFPGERSERENRGCPLDSQLFVYTINCEEGSDERRATASHDRPGRRGV